MFHTKGFQSPKNKVRIFLMRIIPSAHCDFQDRGCLKPWNLNIYRELYHLLYSKSLANILCFFELIL